MFAKLAKKYNVPDPFSHQNASMTTGIIPNAAAPSQFGSSGGFGSPLAPTASLFGGTPAGSSFGASTSSTIATQSPFGGAPVSTFSGATSSSTPFNSSSEGFGKPVASPFGQQTPVASPFCQNSQPVMSSYDKPSMPSFGATPGGGATFGGKTAREILVAFYQQRNPSKISEVDKLLAKYAGKEELLLRNLAKKYNLNPSLFGLSAAPAPAFGSPTAMGQPSTFGQTAPAVGGGFGSSAASSGFGSFGQAAQTNPGGFGSLSTGAGFGSSTPAPAANGLGNNTGFGSSSPFGAARR
jgi:hypothetical protein